MSFNILVNVSRHRVFLIKREFLSVCVKVERKGKKVYIQGFQVSLCIDFKGEQG